VKYRQVRYLEGMRVSPHVYMQEEDLDRFVTALERVIVALR
jgi:selenocysteine lyase/cysteine desulfurase